MQNSSDRNVLFPLVPKTWQHDPKSKCSDTDNQSSNNQEPTTCARLVHSTKLTTQNFLFPCLLKSVLPMLFPCLLKVAGHQLHVSNGIAYSYNTIHMLILVCVLSTISLYTLLRILPLTFEERSDTLLHTLYHVHITNEVTKIRVVLKCFLNQ